MQSRLPPSNTHVEENCNELRLLSDAPTEKVTTPTGPPSGDPHPNGEVVRLEATLSEYRAARGGAA
jgi:hypothetical protein